MPRDGLRLLVCVAVRPQLSCDSGDRLSRIDILHLCGS